MSLPSPTDDPCEIAVTLFPLEGDHSLPLSLAEGLLDQVERERAASFRFEVHRARYIRGRGMVRALLARRLGADPRSLVFRIGTHGKPALVTGDLAFNLSHSEGRAALAIAIGESAGLGIDFEGYDRRVDIEGLARRCFRESEIAWMRSFAPEERHRAFFRIWTAKEARMKATGEGFHLPPQRIALEFEDGFPVRCLEPFSPRAHLEALRLEDSGAACCVVALRPFRVRLEAAPDLS